ncbi:hypothetical protein DH2020_040682 [Rehmannia glutinosa]|uniref:NAC domain-containing protein n=1 Tax=Rehmannia glutinosa TaxID=99300 RepID=A0ABR0UTF4_REHGL
MARTSLPPGFRFHPTDVELVMYYLKRKVLGKKLHLEAIAEVNIYKFSPWDLPDKSCLKSKDLEWFFFCPREKKYASGVRVKRATENGYWKTTGKDRPIHHNDKTVGTVKTLVFHLGHAPQGERTDWVLHEYRILDNQLAAAGVQDMYVLCKVFKKNGPGPKNGAQYGAPFNEADWDDDDDVDGAQNHAISLASDAPSPTTLLQTEEQSCPHVTGLFGSGSKSGLPLIEGPSPSSGHPTSEVFVEETDDEMVRLLAQFTDDDMLLFHEDGVNKDDFSGKGKNTIPCSNGYDIYNGLGDLEIWSRLNGDRLDFSGKQGANNSLENMLLPDNSTYIELDDFLPPLDCSAGVTGTVQSSVGDEIFGSYRHENVQQFDAGSSFTGMDQRATCTNQLPLLPEGSYDGDNCLDMLQMVNNPFYQGCNTAFDLDFALGQLDNEVDFTQDIERGSCAD